MADPNLFTTPFQLTRSMHRDVYPAVDPRNPEFSAKGKIVIITGAGGALGSAIAKAWAQAGAAGIVLIGRTVKTLNMTVEDIANIDESIPIIAEPTDVANEASVKSLFANVKAKFGKAHVLINSAADIPQGKIGDGSIDSWWGAYETNVKGSVIMIQSFIQSFGSQGTIINLVSLAAGMTVPGFSSYASTKLALVHIGQFLHVEYPNIRVFSVHPGMLAPHNRGRVFKEYEPYAKDTHALTGGVLLWLDTPKADFLRGGFVSVNWDVNEMEDHADEIREGKLNQLGFLNAKLGADGHPWGRKNIAG